MLVRDKAYFSRDAVWQFIGNYCHGWASDNKIRVWDPHALAISQVQAERLKRLYMNNVSNILLCHTHANLTARKSNVKAWDGSRNIFLSCNSLLA
jgi:hypothetical protein